MVLSELSWSVMVPRRLATLPAVAVHARATPLATPSLTEQNSPGDRAPAQPLLTFVSALPDSSQRLMFLLGCESRDPRCPAQTGLIAEPPSSTRSCTVKPSRKVTRANVVITTDHPSIGEAAVRTRARPRSG